MKKVIALSSVLALSALGMACGDAGTANNATNKPTNVNKPATPSPTPAATVSNTNTTAPSNTNSTAAPASTAGNTPAAKPAAANSK